MPCLRSWQARQSHANPFGSLSLPPCERKTMWWTWMPGRISQSSHGSLRCSSLNLRRASGSRTRFGVLGSGVKSPPATTAVRVDDLCFAVAEGVT